MITEQEIQQFSEMGAVTIDTPLTQQQLSAASAVFDRLLPFSEPEAGEEPRYRVSTTCTFYDPELLDIIQHPFFEEVAKRVLRADEISFFQTAIVTTYPAPNTPSSASINTWMSSTASRISTLLLGTWFAPFLSG